MTQSFKIILNILLLPIPLQLFAQKNEATQVDTSTFSHKTVTIDGKKYTGFLTPNGFQLLNARNKIYLKHSGFYYFDWEFKDFNKDGYMDIYLDKGSNTPERFDMLLYVPASKSFKQIKDFENFPAPIKINGTKYYYSYHKSGCADMNWDSDLFYIKDFKAIRIGNISGRQCNDRDIKDGLYISKVRNEKKNIIKTLPIETVYTFKDLKWGFIKEYWTKNYALFL